MKSEWHSLADKPKMDAGQDCIRVLIYAEDGLIYSGECIVLNDGRFRFYIDIDYIETGAILWAYMPDPPEVTE